MIWPSGHICTVPMSSRVEMASCREWISADETAKQFLTRVFTERPLLLLPPPLHRIPLRPGNVVEIVGPSSSSKTSILIQAAINCILPKEWKGVNYGGLERLVMFVDLDCRFDVLSLSRSLKQRIIRANGNGVGRKLKKVDDSPSGSKDAHAEYDKELFTVSMRRFLYIRCYDSFEFLATLKTLHFQLQKEKEAHGTGVYLLMIDRVLICCGGLILTSLASAYHWHQSICVNVFKNW